MSWRSIFGPAWRVVLAEHGAGAKRTAKALGMSIEGGVAYLTDRTADLAEGMLAKHNHQPKPYPADVQASHAAIVRLLEAWKRENPAPKGAA